MSEVSIAERIKRAIIDNGGYQHISEETGISKSTLARIASSQTEPKLKDVMAIARATGVSLNFISYGMLTEDEEDSALAEKKMFGLIIDMVRNVNREVSELRQQVGMQEPKGSLNNTFSVDQLRAELLQQIAQSDDLPNIEGLSSKEQGELLLQLTKEETEKRGLNLEHMLEPTSPNKSK